MREGGRGRGKSRSSRGGGGGRIVVVEGKYGKKRSWW